MLPDCRRIDEKPASRLLHGARLVIRHAFEHLDFHQLFCSEILAQRERQRHIEKIVARHPEPHRCGIFQAAAELDHAAEVRIGLRLT